MTAAFRLQFCALAAVLLTACAAAAAPYAAMVMDARSGEVLHARNADTRLHPASLTKMMTLYVVFEAVERGEIGLDTRVRISGNAARTPYAQGYREGTRIRLRHLIRAAAIRSSNDATVAMAEAIEGSVPAFARRMNRTAKALGMRNTTFKNPHGLTQSGHLSTARDMTVMGRRLFFDFPEYYNLFARRTADIDIKTVRNTNHAVLNQYRGADGIKTGYTRAAGFNLVSSAQRGQERIIATVFGAPSSAWRTERMMQLLDLGFERAPSRVAVMRPVPPAYGGADGTAGRAARTTGLVARSMRPPAAPRPEATMSTRQGDLQEAIEDGVTEAIIGTGADAGEAAVPADAAEAETAAAPAPGVEGVAEDAAPEALEVAEAAPAGPKRLSAADRPLTLAAASSRGRLGPEAAAAKRLAPPKAVVAPRAARAARIVRAAEAGRWSVDLGPEVTRYAAGKTLMRAALAAPEHLAAAPRATRNDSVGWVPTFAALSQSGAEAACARIAARGMTCETVAP